MEELVESVYQIHILVTILDEVKCYDFSVLTLPHNKDIFHFI